MPMRNFLAALASAVLLCTAVSLAAPNDVLDWIATLPGVTTTTRTSHGATYAMTNVEGTWDRVRTGLRERGWRVHTNARVTAPGAEVRTAIATRGSQRLKLSLQDAVAAAVLRVSWGGGDEDDADADDTTTVETSPVEVGGSSLVINDNNRNVHYRCDSSNVVVNGNTNEVTLTGTCHALTVNGNGNRVVVNAAVRSIVNNGNHNRVTWSAARNTRPPSVVHNGSGGSVERGP